MEFMDAENSSEPIMFQSRRYGFGDGWMAVVNALGVSEESPFRNLEQILYSEPSHPPIKNFTHLENQDS